MDQPTQFLPRSGPAEATQHIPRATPQQVPGTPAPPPVEEKKRKRRFDPLSILLVVVIVLALVAAGVIGGELYARNRADNVVAEAASCVAEDDATVSFGTMPPFLWQHWTGHYDNISITTAGNQIQSAKGMKAEVSINDVKLHGGKFGAGTIGALNATIVWSADGIKSTVQDSLPLLNTLLNNVKTNPSNGTIDLQGTFGSIRTKPQVVDQNIRLEVISIDTLGLPWPPDLVQSTLDGLTTKFAEQLPLGIHADSVQVTDSGVVGHFSTQGADIPQETDPCFANL